MSPPPSLSPVPAWMGGEPPAATFLLREPRFSPAAAAGAKGRAARDRSLITPLPPPAPDPRAGGTSEDLEGNTGGVTAPARRRGSSRSVAELTAVGGSHQLLLLAPRWMCVLRPCGGSCARVAAGYSLSCCPRARCCGPTVIPVSLRRSRVQVDTCEAVMTDPPPTHTHLLCSPNLFHKHLHLLFLNLLILIFNSAARPAL